MIYFQNNTISKIKGREQIDQIGSYPKNSGKKDAEF